MNCYHPFRSLSAGQLRTLARESSLPEAGLTRHQIVAEFKARGLNRVLMEWVPISKGSKTKVSRLRLSN